MIRPAGVLRASWTSTLQLPKSKLPPRPRQPSPYLETCTDQLYAWQRSRPVAKQFILHDGPPFANGDLHIGHAINKILKDIICRFQLSKGNQVHFVPGWDCHGLPIEHKALQDLSDEHESLGPVRVRDTAKQLVRKTVEEQKKSFREWAIMGDWDQPYFTMDPEFEIRQLGIFKDMVKHGMIHRSSRPIYWSPSSKTALAESELEYNNEHRSLAAFIGFPVVRFPSKLLDLRENPGATISVLIWTTTPWTLPANQAIAIHRNIEYCVAALEEQPNSKFLIARARVDFLRSFLEEHQKIVEFGPAIRGSDLLEMFYTNPLHNSPPQPVVHANFVTESSGTGIVHLAPGHGMDDYKIGLSLGLSPISPVDEEGNFTVHALPRSPDILAGKPVHSEGTLAVLQYLHESDPSLVVATHEVVHKYPMDWRTKTPVIVRTTEQWFMDLDLVKTQALQVLETVRFVPDSGRSRLESFLRGRDTWCISRQRAWGVPIPALFRVDKIPREAVLTTASIQHIIDVIAVRGIDAWWTDREDDPAWIPAGMEGTYVRGKDTMDVWFDSGTSWTIFDPEGLGDPVADVYLEGSDQHRGWFQSSLITYVARQMALGRKSKFSAPFRTLITHGFTLDCNGRKMSKSIGNVISPSEIIAGTLLPSTQLAVSNPSKIPATPARGRSRRPEALGADSLRLWVASSDFKKDISVVDTALQQAHQLLLKLRITFKWLLGVLSGFEPQIEVKLESEYQLLDEVALQQLFDVSSSVHKAYENFEFNRVISILNNYVIVDLSGFYFETLKDRLYTGTLEERLPAQFVLYNVFNELLSFIAPLTPLLAAEVWAHTPEHLRSRGDPCRRVWTPISFPLSFSEDNLRAFKCCLESANSAVKFMQEIARKQGLIGSGLETEVHVRQADDILPDALISQLISPQQSKLLASAFVVSRVHIHEKTQHKSLWDEIDELGSASPENWPVRHNFKLVKATGSKCGRCWKYLEVNEMGICNRCETVIRNGWPEILDSKIT